ncbi:DUF2797 domain-containing protein [Mangrovimicrobium sediminis]|uniref:DUF2797 domain-containing protein n=1 Tax=Mangrovimicrobium sediminis TaxID=2562682 RepID=A0A4Z0M5K4_9GAMM|nr:DUF2797 domain-containing protein [Haliea sp. SAOS-164]TGD74781.1 DUF2797 domain-containing protein [Haliea sp. SAOS-164]
MSEALGSGAVRKMVTALEDPVSYALPLGDTEVAMNALLGQSLQLRFEGQINCVACGRKTSKSFNQGYCFPCFKSLAQCDSCIVSPEKCHYHQGTCREPAWGETHCMIEHVVYLANTSGLKVGITRHSQVPTRWMDQGATQAQPIFRVDTRLHSGVVEHLFKDHVADKTSWQAMLKGDAEALDLEAERTRLMEACAPGVERLREEYGVQAITELAAAPETRISYPVLEYPVKVKSFNLDKTPLVEGTLLGIKGQYLIFDTGVINMRKYGGYALSASRSN